MPRLPPGGPGPSAAQAPQVLGTAVLPERMQSRVQASGSPEDDLPVVEVSRDVAREMREIRIASAAMEARQAAADRGLSNPGVHATLRQQRLQQQQQRLQLHLQHQRQHANQPQEQPQQTEPEEPQGLDRRSERNQSSSSSSGSSMLRTLLRCLCRGSPPAPTSRASAGTGAGSPVSGAHAALQQQAPEEVVARPSERRRGGMGPRGPGHHSRSGGRSSRMQELDAELLEQLELAREARDLEIALQRSLEEGHQGSSGASLRPEEQRSSASRGAQVQRVGAGGDELQRLLLERMLLTQVPDGDTPNARRLLSRIPRRADAGASGQGSEFFLGGGVDDRRLNDFLEQSRRQHLVRELPREVYSKHRHTELSECELCLEEYVEGAELMRLPCLHVFHSSCVAPWLQKAKSCPVCQIDVCQAAGL
eukprot:TRINITY_DN28428_c0_g1_i1.p1 TRINITY_DN28428_c0_g1~~TRINITY_DN28428_c0_g1_i1.p1  ORF type:complete len:422 (-),score=78.71 TRINITY_DN28428_c0_g1_i1:18-1283(-)